MILIRPFAFCRPNLRDALARCRPALALVVALPFAFCFPLLAQPATVRITGPVYNADASLVRSCSAILTWQSFLSQDGGQTVQKGQCQFKVTNGVIVAGGTSNVPSCAVDNDALLLVPTVATWQSTPQAYYQAQWSCPSTGKSEFWSFPVGGPWTIGSVRTAEPPVKTIQGPVGATGATGATGSGSSPWSTSASGSGVYTATRIVPQQVHGALTFGGITDGLAIGVSTFNTPTLIDDNGSTNPTPQNAPVDVRRTDSGPNYNIGGQTFAPVLTISHQSTPTNTDTGPTLWDGLYSESVLTSTIGLVQGVVHAAVFNSVTLGAGAAFNNLAVLDVASHGSGTDNPTLTGILTGISTGAIVNSGTTSNHGALSVAAGDFETVINGGTVPAATGTFTSVTLFSSAATVIGVDSQLNGCNLATTCIGLQIEDVSGAATSRAIYTHSGSVVMGVLSGTGNRLVQADVNGNLSAAIVVGGSATVTVRNSSGTGSCTLTFTGGQYVSTTC